MRISAVLLSIVLALTPASLVLAQDQVAAIPTPAPIMRWIDVVRLHQSAQFGIASKQTELGQVYMGNRGIPEDDDRARAWLMKAADQDYANAQLWLGIMYRYGDGVSADPVVAANWFRRAAAQGDGSAQHFLGEMYADGLGVAQDYVTAYMWYDLAATAEKGGFNGQLYVESRDAIAAKMTPAQRTAAQAKVEAWRPAPLTADQQFTASWDGLADDKIDKTLETLLQLADQGHSGAEFLLGGLYYQGRGVTRDDALAAKWYQKAAVQGHAWAQCMLGTMYIEGRGVPEDDAVAADWLRKASDQGIATAQYRLAMLYMTGRGVPKDDKAGEILLREAANQGLGNAQALLGGMTAAGRFGAPDLAEGYKWFKLAETYGVSDDVKDAMVGTKSKVMGMMTPALYAQSEKRIQDWVPTFPKP